MGKILNQSMKNGKLKESYAAPEVTRIRLFGDEMVCGACKSVPLETFICQNGPIIVNRDIGS